MLNRNKGIRGILPPVSLPQEQAQDAAEIAAAKDYVRKRLGPISEYKSVDPSLYLINSKLDLLQAAPKQVKDKDGFTPAQNAQIHKYLTRPADPFKKAEIADKIKRGKLPSKEGMKTLQYVTDSVKQWDGKPETHKPRWMVNYQNGELEDVNDPKWMDNQIKQGLVPDSLVKQHKAENKPKIQKTNFGYVKTIPEKKSTVQQLEALKKFGQNPLVNEKKV